jgi:hypothetical protein
MDPQALFLNIKKFFNSFHFDEIVSSADTCVNAMGLATEETINMVN